MVINFWLYYYRSDAIISRRHMILICLITIDVLGTLSLQGKVMIFLFVISKCPVGRYFEII